MNVIHRGTVYDYCEWQAVFFFSLPSWQVRYVTHSTGIEICCILKKKKHSWKCLERQVHCGDGCVFGHAPPRLVCVWKAHWQTLPRHTASTDRTRGWWIAPALPFIRGMYGQRPDFTPTHHQGDACVCVCVCVCVCELKDCGFACNCLSKPKVSNVTVIIIVK